VGVIECIENESMSSALSVIFLAFFLFAVVDELCTEVEIERERNM
jgi:hypothetical protein